MRIAICDDIPKELEKILAALDVYKEAHPELCFEIDKYSTALDILHAVEQGKGYDIAFLDICMPGILGTDVAGEMLAQSPDMGIIFLTISNEYAVAAFAMNATHYLLKPFSQAEFDMAMDRAVKKVMDCAFISLSCVDGMYRIRISEIVFIESQGHFFFVTSMTLDSEILSYFQSYIHIKLRIAVGSLCRAAILFRYCGNGGKPNPISTVLCRMVAVLSFPYFAVKAVGGNDIQLVAVAVLRGQAEIAPAFRYSKAAVNGVFHQIPEQGGHVKLGNRQRLRQLDVPVHVYARRNSHLMIIAK